MSLPGTPGTPRELTELSDFQAWLNMSKSGIGLIAFTLSMVTGKVGTVPAIIAMLVMCMASLWFMLLVGRCKNRLQPREEEESDPLYRVEASTLGAKLDNTPTWESGLGYLDSVVEASCGRAGRLLATVSILSLQFSNGVVFIISVASGVPSAFPAVSRNSCLLGVCIIFVLLSLTNRLRKVTYLSGAAMGVIAFVALCLVYEASRHPRSEHVTTELWKTTGCDYGELFAAAAYLFGILPICDRVHLEMRCKSHFPYIAALSYLTILIVGMFIGLLGYYTYGTEAEELIYLNFPDSSKRLVVVCMVVIMSVTCVLHNVPIYMFLQEQLPRVHYAVLNGSVVCCQVLVAYWLTDLMTASATLSNASNVLVCWLLPGVAFLILSHRYERCEQLTTVLAMLLGIVGCAAAFASA